MAQSPADRIHVQHLSKKRLTPLRPGNGVEIKDEEAASQ
jgi:hypothetical protein